ncbi:uncharacterized protein METZ01_LOCUS444855, partial [marine metagenome]
MSRVSGFTMIEVLITLGIIIILMVALMPAINAAREYSRSVECQSNQQQILDTFLARRKSLGATLRAETL